MSLDPVQSNPNHYSVLFENDRVRVLEYTDAPGDATTLHEHPDSVMYTLSAFRRRLHSHGCLPSSIRVRTSATHRPTSSS